MNNPKDIRREPQWSIIEFGDGLQAMMQGAIETEIEGIRVIEATIKPGEDLIKRYNIKEEDLNDDGNIEQYKMPYQDVIWLNIHDDANRKLLYVKNYLHEDTDLSNWNWELRKIYEEEQKKRIITESENIFLSEQIKLAIENPPEYLAQGLDIIKRLNEQNIADILNKKQNYKE